MDDYIKRCREEGLGDEQIKSNLRYAGWSEADIEAGFQFPRSVYNPVTTNSQQPQGWWSTIAASHQNIRRLALSNKKIFLMSAIILFFLIALVLYFPLSSLLVKSRVVAGAQKIRASNIKWEAVISLADNKSYKTTLEGYLNHKNKNDPIADMALGIDIPTSEGINIRAEAAIKMVEGKVYIKLEDTIDSAGMFDFSTIKDQWVYVDLDGLEKISGSSKEELTQLNTSGLGSIFASKSIYKEFKKTRDEEVNGVMCHKFNFAIDNNRLADAFVDAILPKEKDKKPNKGTIKSMKNEMRTALKDVGSIRGVIYSSRKGYLLQKAEVYAKSKDFSIDMSIKYSDIGKERKVEAPKDFRTLEEVLGGKAGHEE